MQSIWRSPRNIKANLYPEAKELQDRFQKTYWLVNEVPFSADPGQIKMMREVKRESILRSLLSISSLEIKVKDSWPQLGTYIPHTEWANLGLVCGESEVRHYDSYSKLIELLGLEDRFLTIKDIPALDGRFKYLSKYLKYKAPDDGIKTKEDKIAFIKKLILFSFLVENTSLFANFATLMYFYSKEGKLKDIRNIVAWTSIDEISHFQTGMTLLNIIRREEPELFDDALEKEIIKACKKSIDCESNILDWIFELGELETMKKADLLDLMKDRVNMSMRSIGFKDIYPPEELDLSKTKFFYREVLGDKLPDFFIVRPNEYTLNDKSITAEDLF